MSEDFADNEDEAWEDELRRIFLECLASSSSNSSLCSLPSTTSEVHVSTLVDYIRDNAFGSYRPQALLDELQTAIEEVSSNGRVNWTLFKKASRRWVNKIQHSCWQDGNNNIEKNDSNDDLLGRSDDEKGNSEGDSGNGPEIVNTVDRCRKPKTPRRFVTAGFVNLSNVSSYSPTSDTIHGFGMSTDTTPESADDTDVGIGGCGEVAQVDLRLRVRRFDEENAALREELVRAEELSAGFQRQFEKLRRKLDRTNERCQLLECENDEHKEILHEIEQKERNCRWALQKAEKERAVLVRKLEEAEAERQLIASVTSELEACKREKLDCARDAIVCRQEAEERQNECDMLREKLARIVDDNDSLRESYEETVRHLREQNQDLKNQIFDLHAKQSLGSLSDGISSTPPASFLNCHTQSTPYSETENVQLHDSLYAELKASGFSIEDAANGSRVRELEEELSWYNEEITDAVGQIENVLEKLDGHRKSPHVPNLSLDTSSIGKTADIYDLLRKISKLSNVVNEMIWKPKVKDASSQLCVDLATHAERRICSQYGILNFDDYLRLQNDNPEGQSRTIGEESNERPKKGFFAEAFTIDGRTIGANDCQSANATESHRETLSPSVRGSMKAPPEIQERTIIDPIVEELDRILQCTNRREDLPSNHSPTKNPKFRCIYTCAQPSSERRPTEPNCSATESSFDSHEDSKRDLATTYVIASAGDAPSFGMVDENSLANVDQAIVESTVSTISHENSEKLSNDSSLSSSSSSPSSSKTRQSNTTGISESSIIADDSIDSKINDSESRLENSSSLASSSNPEESSTPRNIDQSSFVDDAITTNPNGLTYRVTPDRIIRKNPKRKISVFHRSFDVDTLHAIDEAGGHDTYRLTERSMSTPNPNDEKSIDDNMELDIDCSRKLTNLRNFSINDYRTRTSHSDSSECSSPEKSYDRAHDDDSSMTEISDRGIARPIVLSPKFKLPSTNESSIFAMVDEKFAENRNDDGNVAIEESSSKTTNDKRQGDSIARERRETYDVWKIRENENDSRNTCEIRETIRPGDEVERGITFRRGRFDRETDFSSYSLMTPTENSTIDDTRDAKIANVSTIVLSSDGDSTSCDSSPIREARPYLRPDHSKSRDPLPRARSSEIVVGCDGYKKRNGNAIVIINSSSSSISTTTISSSNVVSYVGGGGIAGGGRIRAFDEKTNVLPAVALAMSSGEDSSDSECDPMAIRSNDVDDTRSISPGVLPFVNGAFLGSSTPAPTSDLKNVTSDDGCNTGPEKSSLQRQDKRERFYRIRRSLSESGCGRSESSCRCTTVDSIQTELNKDESRPVAFPSLTDTRLHESGIANLSSSDEIGGSLSEADLERKSIALSIGLVTDRVTLPRRMALSIRQRDQSERNLACEIQKMHQDIQDLAPLCIDRESLERVEMVRHQLEMITQCAHRVSCTAETLGAVHQEHRISRAVLLADRYLLVLRSRCEKLASNLAETKRILTENNIVVEENNGELGDDLPRIRYRGMPTNNRTMMARRRASIATIFRPLGNFQDVTKDGVRQRNSVSGRVTLRRPSLAAESHKWEADKLDRTDSSSSSIGELREIFEQAESRRGSREENNNVLRLHSSNLSIRDCENTEGDAWTTTREEPIEELIPTVDGCRESRLGRRTPLAWMTHTNVPWKPMLWCIIISFILGFYMKHVVSTVSGCSGTPLRWWSLEEILGRYVDMKNDSPRPI